MHEAVQAHYAGLEANLALASVTSHPADLMGKGHRIGYLRTNYDADVVIWNAHPLQLGASPKQVFVDGIPQLVDPAIVELPAALQEGPPGSANFTAEIAEVLQSHGDPDLSPLSTARDITFVNVNSVVVRDDGKLTELFSAASGESVAASGEVIVTGGRIVCAGNCKTFARGKTVIDLKGGSISPGLTAFGLVVRSRCSSAPWLILRRRTTAPGSVCPRCETLPVLPPSAAQLPDSEIFPAPLRRPPVTPAPTDLFRASFLRVPSDRRATACSSAGRRL